MAAKSNSSILIGTFVVSSISLALLIVSITTPTWVNATAEHPAVEKPSEVNYGLFSGTIVRHVLETPNRYDIKLICDYEQSACMYSCQVTPEQRLNELHRILNGLQLNPCPIQVNTKINSRIFNSQIDFDHYELQRAEQNSTRKDQCIKPNLWVTTIVFLSFAIFFTSIAAGFSMFNVLSNPSEPILNIFGIYIWNGISAGSSLIALSVWGSLFDGFLKHNIAVTDTLDLYTSEGLSSIGYSYYMILVAMILNLVNIGLLAFRNYIVDREIEPVTFNIDNNDAPLEFY